MMRLRAGQCFLTMLLCCFTLLAAARITDPSEVSALRAIKNSLVDPVKHLKNWNKGDPCTSNWTGVLCFDEVGNDSYLHVQQLLLLHKNLSGTLARELGQLSQLRILDFMWNDMSGSIPKEVGNIASLELLLLNGNRLSGSLSSELGYLSNLDRFQIDENLISGPIPESFSNLNSVRHIHFNNNSLSGHIPHQLSNLPNLLHLLLDNNNLSGNLPPELSNIPELRILDGSWGLGFRGRSWDEEWNERGAVADWQCKRDSGGAVRNGHLSGEKGDGTVALLVVHIAGAGSLVGFGEDWVGRVEVG